MMEEILITLTEVTLAGDKIPASDAEEMYRQLDIVKEQIRRRALVTDADRARWKAEDEAKLRARKYDDGSSDCEGCRASAPGVIFPIEANEYSEHAWVHRCSECELFESDLEAALFIGCLLRLEVKMGFHTDEYSACPFIEGISIDAAEDLMVRYHKKYEQFIKEEKHGDEGNTGGLRVHASDQVPHDSE